MIINYSLSRFRARPHLGWSAHAANGRVGKELGLGTGWVRSWPGMAQWAHNCEHPLSFCPANVRYYTLLHSHQCGGSSWPARARASCGAMRRSEGEHHQHQPVNASNNHPSWEKQARKLNKKHLQHSNVQNEVRLVRWIGLERPKLRSICRIVCPLM